MTETTGGCFDEKVARMRLTDGTTMMPVIVQVPTTGDVRLESDVWRTRLPELDEADRRMVKAV